ncbi:DUF4166 domain-containing protein [Flavisphingomonas formosensis]|uniref:DUF4166 domain-containing protein n=1 Tax=Flavisphingomonas formosensis TaxID=861534 RepID=UPI0012F79D00|nr:DUF4166 domain-containing protein [Sphingomonas formosensis]
MAQPIESIAAGEGRAGEAALVDLRFRTLLGAGAWAVLPAAVRARFSKRLAGGAAVTYVGEVAECRMSRLGWLLAQFGRLIGAPLPLGCDIGVPAVVSVTEDAARGGQFWTRLYGRIRGFPQVIHSSKRFAGCTGLEEYLGFGCGIALRVSADESALHFHSDHYFVGAGRLRLRIPAWLGPGRLTISHEDRGDGRFAFRLLLCHPLFGELIRQTCLFRDQPLQPGGR